MITYVLLAEEDTIFEPIFGCKMVHKGGGNQLESMYELQLSSEMKKCLRGSEILNDHPGLIEPQIADCNGEHPM